ncbi:hypothetical protein JP0163_03290 [Helicobacter pylori]
MHKALKSGGITTKRAVFKQNLGVLSTLIILVIESKSPPIKGAVLESGLIVKSVGSITKIRTIKGTCALKIKTATIKGGIIGSAKIFIENECPPHSISPR